MDSLNHYNTDENENQDVNYYEPLKDDSASGRARPWKEKKSNTMKLADIYDYVDYDKAERLRDCGNVLGFTVAEDGKKTLHSANFCRVRLCPMCQWRRSLKVYANMTRVINSLGENYAIVCLTLTVQNCRKQALSDILDNMASGFNRLSMYKDFKSAVIGYYRSTEITHNLDKHSKDYDTMHPHFHCLLVVNKSYFVSRYYISHDKWVSMWQKALKIDYRPSVEVHKLYLKNGQDITQALCEVTKYTVKDGDMITDDINLDVDTLSILDQALDKRKFMTLGGILKDLHKKLNLTDLEDDSDLIHVGEETEITEYRKNIITYVWHSGYKQYFRSR